MLKIERDVPEKLAEKKEDHKHDAIVQFCFSVIQIVKKHFQQNGLYNVDITYWAMKHKPQEAYMSHTYRSNKLEHHREDHERYG